MKVFFCLVSLILPSLTHAGDTCRILHNRPYIVKKFTNYAPSAGGINGRCGTSASGLNACKFALEDYLNGSTTSVMGAVPQRGGTEGLFGGVYRAVALEKKLGNPGCVRVVVADRYGKSSNNKSKMDIVTRKARSKITQRVNMSSGELYVIGRAKGVKASRKLKRMVAAKY